MDDARIAKAIRDLEQAAGHRLMEINQAATALLLKGTEVEGLPDWDHGRNQPVKFIDFAHPENNDFLVINQFKVELTSGRGHVIPDAVLFVNGIPQGSGKSLTMVFLVREIRTRKRLKRFKIVVVTDRTESIGIAVAVGDYLAGMTDRYCEQQYERYFQTGKTTASAIATPPSTDSPPTSR